MNERHASIWNLKKGQILKPNKVLIQICTNKHLNPFHKFVLVWHSSDSKMRFLTIKDWMNLHGHLLVTVPPSGLSFCSIVGLLKPCSIHIARWFSKCFLSPIASSSVFVHSAFFSSLSWPYTSPLRFSKFENISRALWNSSLQRSTSLHVRTAFHENFSTNSLLLVAGYPTPKSIFVSSADHLQVN
jgi:hypothetical protein